MNATKRLDKMYKSGSKNNNVWFAFHTQTHFLSLSFSIFIQFHNKVVSLVSSICYRQSYHISTCPTFISNLLLVTMCVSFNTEFLVSLFIFFLFFFRLQMK